jgi:hypothetical protein
MIKSMLVQITATSLLSTSASELLVAEGHYLLEKQVLSKVKQLIYQAGTLRPAVYKRDLELRQN